MTPYYQDAYVTLYHGDCRDVIQSVGLKADHVVTDPPYDLRTHAGARTNKIGRKGEQLIKFDPIEPQWVVPLLTSVASKWVIAFCALEMLGEYSVHADVHGRWVRAGFWHRPDGAPQISGDRPAQPGEGVAIWHAKKTGRIQWNGGGHRAFWSYGVVRGAERVHDTQKPVKLMAEILSRFTQPSDVVADLFAGSGTTGVAAKQMGQRAVLVEIDEATCESAAFRLAGTQVSLFA